jgi:hypothetical protein
MAILPTATNARGYMRGTIISFLFCSPPENQEFHNDNKETLEATKE